MLHPLPAHLQLLPRRLLRGINPFLIRLPTPILRLLHPNNPLHHLPNKPNKIPPPQRILPRPSSPLPLLTLQRLHIPNLPCPRPRVLHHRHQIKMRLLRRIPRNPPLQHLNHLLGKRRRITRAMANRMRLQSIQLIQRAINRRVRDKVVHIRGILFVLGTGRFIRERACAGEGVMRGADSFRVGEGFTAEFGREACCEVFEGAQFVTEGDGRE